jgi:hypothetical protein
MMVAPQVEHIPERLAETVERYTPRMPSMAYFGMALGAVALLLWSVFGMYIAFTDDRAASLRWRRTDLHPPGV